MPSDLLVPISIAIASFLGSWHCAGMCSPLAVMAASQNSLWPYHLGRLISYLLLGLIAGAFGDILFSNSYFWVRTLSAILISLALLYSGVSLIFPQLANARYSPSQWAKHLIQNFVHGLNKIFRLKFINQGFLIGLCTGFLPCGWLYTFVIAAVSTRSIWGGSILLFVFWIGTIPSLTVAATLVRAPLKKLSATQRVVPGVILILAGFYSLFSHLYFGYSH